MEDSVKVHFLWQALGRIGGMGKTLLKEINAKNKILLTIEEEPARIFNIHKQTFLPTK